jgi:putative salt-induced outer membrane protein
MTGPRRRCLPAVLLALVAAPLAAQEAPPRRWAVKADLGYVVAGGNTELQALNFGDKLTFDPAGALRFAQTVSWIYSTSDEETTANLIAGEVRGDYDLTPRLAAYGFGGFYRNTFAGVSRRFSEGIGLGYRPVLAPRDTLLVEGGVSLFQERQTSGLTDDFTTARLAGWYKHLLTDRAWVSLGTQFLPDLSDLGDYLLDANAELGAPLSTNVAVKLGYLVRYQSEPAPGFEDTDTVFTSGIQLTF